MRSARVLGSLCLWLAACSGRGVGDGRAPQAHVGSTGRYTYPACPDVDDGCGGLNALGCAFNAIHAKYAACREDADCVKVYIPGDCAVAGCGSAVRRTAAAAFTAEAGREVARYCAQRAKCEVIPECLPQEPVCRNGRCELEVTPLDGGR